MKPSVQVAIAAQRDLSKVDPKVFSDQKMERCCIIHDAIVYVNRLSSCSHTCCDVRAAHSVCLVPPILTNVLLSRQWVPSVVDPVTPDGCAQFFIPSSRYADIKNPKLRHGTLLRPFGDFAVAPTVSVRAPSCSPNESCILFFVFARALLR